MEIWNLVFIQNNRKKDGSLEPLPARHVDTGMGFERVSAVLQHQRSNYDTDVFTPIIERIADVSGRPYQGETSQVAMRVIADHVRMLSFSIADGAIPGNEGRGYVLRRILRRASRNLGIREPFLFRIPEAVAATMGSVFPEISEKRLHIERIIKAEEESFNATLDRGLEIFSSVLQKNQDTKTFPGEEAFRLYDTYGFPLDLTELMAQERGLTVDVTAFSALMEEQRRRARDSGKMVAADVNTILTRLGDLRDTTFVGYTQLEAHTSIREVIDGKYVSLDQSPFYVESGGQVDDTGIIRGKGFVGEVLNSLKRDKKVVHEIRIVEGKPVPGDAVDAIVDKESRLSTQRNHSATHLLHEALRRVLGTHLRQHGSLVAPDRLRFDFNHFERISREQMRAIEEIVNGKIADKIPILALNEPDQWLTIDEARARYPNVKMFFGDKYGDKVRIVEIDPAFSVELCGGTHSANTQDIQLFKIMSESSISSGIRRIEAVTGDGVRKYIEDLGQKVGTMDEEVVRLQEEKDLLEHTLGLSPPTTSVQRERVAITSFPLTIQSLDLLERSIADRQEIVGGLQKDLKELQKQVSRSRVTNAASGIDSLLDSATKLDGIVLAQGRVQASDMEELKSMGDALRLKLQGGVGILGSVIDDKASFVCVVTDDVIKSRGISAGAIVGALAKIVGGGGGGRPHLATAGGKDVSKIDEALAKSESILGDLLRRPPSKP